MYMCTFRERERERERGENIIERWTEMNHLYKNPYIHINRESVVLHTYNPNAGE